MPRPLTRANAPRCANEKGEAATAASPAGDPRFDSQPAMRMVITGTVDLRTTFSAVLPNRT